MPDALAPDPFTAMAAQLTPKRAVSYIRVSTREQAQRGGSEEGFSLPAQREANKRKAQSMGALVVKEFADRGESARSANRPELQKMLAYLKEDGGIDYVIVHKLDRLARNRADDVEINRAFEDAGVRLVSTSENIDQTPGGMLLHGIMSSIAEFYSRNLANEVIKGMGEKARNGGTLGKAPLGYVNVRARDENGREVRTVELDEERAPLIRLAFTEYATGNWTVRQLADHLNTLGLSIPPTPRRCAKPITTTRLHKILRHPYYKGTISFQGVEYVGAHEPLVDEETWSQVQAMLDSHRYGERQRIHNHFLKSTVVCGQCGARLSVQNAKNSKGTIYPYFVCARRCRLHDCTFTAVLIDVVEERMSDLYQTIQLSAADRTQIEHYLHDELAQIEGDKAKAVRSLTTRRTNIEDRRRRLLHAHYEGAIPLDLLKEEQAELSTELNQIERQLAAYQADAAEVRQHLTQALDLLEDCHRLYTAAPDHLKKLLNQVFFQRVLVNPLVDEEGRVILPGAGTSDGANAGGPADTDAAGEETGSEDSASLIADPGHDQAGRRNTSAHDEQHSAGEEGTDDDSRGGAADADTPVLMPYSVHLADTGSGTRLSALLTPPFDQLTSPSLHAAAHAHHLQHLTQPDNSTTPPAAGGTLMSSTTRTTPTLVGERCSISGTASQPVSTEVGSGKSLLVPPVGLEPTTLRF
ncbi:recombinase family protein [Actinomyces naeslundii]|uniref:Recombinase family protein n=1 Tax=Actinomyces naeslundii TaxID=1655 RepID=A0AA47FJF5_ACTNA|nr:recombinase family protein [Actinomyces naeslundii]WAL44260.1 recombinase family protein [Actinomyces naeslundii]